MHRLSRYTFFFISVIFIFIKLQQVFTVEPFIRESYALSWDNYGYYLHLPATIIHHDPGIENKSWLDSLNSKYQKDRPFYQCWAGQKERLVNVYPTGLAICNLPFFIAGHLSAKICGYPADGLSPPYQWAMIFSALCYAIFGIWLMRKLLLKFFDDGVTSILLLLIAFATNLYYYATYNDILPHIFLFTIDCGILLLTISWHEKQKRSTALYLGMLLGLVTITRPSDIVWVLIPLLWNISGLSSLREKVKLLGRYFLHVLLLITGMIAIGSIQLLYWKYTSGHWFSFNHSEGFDFFRPFTLKVLFSYKKGWLIYTPLMIFAIAGLGMMWKQQRNIFFALSVFFLANLWFISSWECWWYAGTFGQRPFVQSYGLMAIPLGFFWMKFSSHKIHRNLLSIVLLFFVWLNLFQTWQLNNDIMSDSLMTKEYYWKIFGRTHTTPEWRKLLEVDRGNLEPLPEKGIPADYTVREVMNLNYENATAAEPRDELVDTAAHTSVKCMRMDKEHLFVGSFNRAFEELTEKDVVRLRFSMDVYCPGDSISRKFNFVFNTIGRRGQSYGYTAFEYDPGMERVKGWKHYYADFVTAVILHRSDLVNMYIWDNGEMPVYFRNVKIEAYEKK